MVAVGPLGGLERPIAAEAMTSREALVRSCVLALFLWACQRGGGPGRPFIEANADGPSAFLDSGQKASTPRTSAGSPPSRPWNPGDGTTNNIPVPAQNSLLADRLLDWSYAGIPGGIPKNAAIYRSLGVPGQASSFSQAVTSTQINRALSSCPSGQVVYLNPGTYSVDQISFDAYVGKTLRGAGAGQTILLLNGRIVNRDITFHEGHGAPVASGYIKGSTSITLASTPSERFRAGSLICLSEEASPNKWGPGVGVYYRSGFPSGSSVYNLNETRCFRHMNRIVSVVGSTLKLAAPIPLDFSPSLDVKAYPQGTAERTSLCGLEDMTLDAQDRIDTPISFISADRCWIQDVELKNVPGSDIGMIRFWQCFQCEIRRCYIHGATGYPHQTDGYATAFNYGSSNCLIIDCIVDKVADLCESNGASACAYLYNYSRDTLRAGIYSRGMTVSHGPHGFMLLVEGNVLSTIANDGYHGSTSHVVVFRNHINGLNSQGPLEQRKLVNLCRGSYFHTLVGNILGDASWRPAYYEFPYAGGSSIQAVYFLGFPAADSVMIPHSGAPVFMNYSKYFGSVLDRAAQYPDPDVARTLIRHGNYDFYNKAVVWDGSIPWRTVPNSLIYSSKPEFFGSLSWPPIGPDVRGFVAPIPAKARWDAYAVSHRISDLFGPI